jgi:hypothetical protein
MRGQLWCNICERMVDVVMEESAAAMVPVITTALGGAIGAGVGHGSGARGGAVKGGALGALVGGLVGLGVRALEPPVHRLVCGHACGMSADRGAA